MYSISTRYRCQQCDVTVTAHGEDPWRPICTCGEEMVPLYVSSMVPEQSAVYDEVRELLDHG